MRTICLFTFLAAQPGIGIGASDGQLGCSVHSGSAVLWGDVVSSPSTARLVAQQQQHFRLLDAVDQGLPKPLGSVCFVFLLLPQPTLGIRVWPLNLPHTLCQCLWVSASSAKFWHTGLTGAGWTSWSSFWWSWVSPGVRRPPWCRGRDGCHLCRQHEGSLFIFYSFIVVFTESKPHTFKVYNLLSFDMCTFVYAHEIITQSKWAQVPLPPPGFLAHL